MTSGSQHSFSSDRSPCFSIESAGALEHTFTETFPALAQPAVPQIPAETGTDWVNAPLARSLDLDSAWLRSDDGVRWLTGTEHAGQELQALGYSGFQFGQLSPVLGDGRAHLLGEWVAREPAQGAPARTDLHLKGSGLTPFSRQGSDGKAPLSAVWREAVIGEFLHATEVPTSRALAVLSTGEKIRRRAPQPELAGILVRVASSHLRVGTFQFAQMQRSAEERMALVEYALRRHYPEVKTGESAPNNPALALLRGVAQRQAKLVAQWMGLGFIHGVLNTDNVSISGEAIDFGSCAFMDIFKRDAVFSSIDQQGRYAYRNQPAITQWNLARFGETLLDLIDPEDPNRAVEQATEVLAEFGDIYRFEHTRVFAEKLGIERDRSAREQRDNEQGGIAGRLRSSLNKPSRSSKKHKRTSPASSAHSPKTLPTPPPATRQNRPSRLPTLWETPKKPPTGISTSPTYAEPPELPPSVPKSSWRASTPCISRAISSLTLPCAR